MGYENAFHPSYPRGTMWVLHRLLGHHPTSPNLRQCETVDDEVVRAMLEHRTYTSRIWSYVEQPSEFKDEVTRIAEWVILILAGIEKCPYCGHAWEGSRTTKGLLSKDDVMLNLPQWKKESKRYFD
jgi:hypothetical protein